MKKHRVIATADEKGKNQWSEKELRVLQDEAGIRVGHPSNSGLLDYPRLPVAVGRLKSKKFRKSKKYKDFVEDFLKETSKANDWGTCCGGAGTVVKKGNMPIDFIRQRGQSDSQNIVAEKIMQSRAKQLGLELRHESGWMD